MAALLAFAFALAWIFDAPAQEMGPKSWWDAMQSVEGHVTGDLEERFSLDPQGGEPGEPGNPDGRDGSVDVAGGGAGNGSGSGGDDADGSGAGGGQNTDGQGNGAIDPSVPEVAQLIQTWINIAEPPPNAEDGASLTYTNGGRMVGTTTTGTIESRHETGAFDAIYLWTNWRKLDSVDHCTMEEYVTVNLSGKSIAHCRGRYKPKIKDWKGWQAAKARTAVTTLKLKAVFRPGGAAPDGAKAGTVANQEPGPGESLAKGGSVTLKIYSEPIKKVEVPDLRGQQVAAATDTLRAIGLKLNLKNGPAASNEADAGTVFGQTPAAGALVKPGATLTAVVYKPFVPKIFVPEITSDNVAEAMAALSDLGLSPVIRTDPPGKENWEDGTVTGFVPASGSEISPGGTVTIVVTVEEPQMVVVPDLRGLRGQAAREQLVGAGLHAEVRSSEPAREPDMTGTVIRTEPANGADVEIGSLVMVFVFDTYVPPKITVPSVIGMPIAEAENVLEQAGLVASIDSFIQAPDPESSMTIAQASPDPGVAIDKGGTVALIVHGRYSAPKIPVPDVVGLSLSQARSRIEAAGLKAMAGPKSDPGDPELAGTVFALKPPAGTKIDANADVLIMAYGAYQPPKPEPAVVDFESLWTSPWQGEIKISKILMDGRQSSLGELFAMTEDRPPQQDDSGSLLDIPGAAVEGALEGIAQAIKVAIGVLEQGIPVSITFTKEGNGYRLDVPGEGDLANAWKEHRQNVPLFIPDGNDSLVTKYMMDGTEYGVSVRATGRPDRKELVFLIRGKFPNVNEESQHLVRELAFEMTGILQPGLVTISELKDLITKRILISAEKYAPDLVPMIKEQMQNLP